MGLEIEVWQKVLCEDSYCIAQALIEAILERIGIGIDTTQVEEHVKRLGGILFDKNWDYRDDREDDIFAFAVGDLKINIYDIKYDVVECHLEGCEGYVSASVELEGNLDTLREIAKAMIRNMGIDKYVKCE
jgi:hypothetical protein